MELSKENKAIGTIYLNGVEVIGEVMMDVELTLRTPTEPVKHFPIQEITFIVDIKRLCIPAAWTRPESMNDRN